MISDTELLGAFDSLLESYTRNRKAEAEEQGWSDREHDCEVAARLALAKLLKRVQESAAREIIDKILAERAAGLK